MLEVSITLLVLSAYLLRATFKKINTLPTNNPTAMLGRSGCTDGNDEEYIVCIGDSITQGTVSAAWVPMLHRLFGSDNRYSSLTMVNAGVNSELAYNVSKRIDTVLSLNPKIVILLIGSNDIKAVANPKLGVAAKKKMNLPSIPTEQFFQDNMLLLLQLLTHNLSDDAKIYVCSIPPLGEDLHSEYNTIHVSRANAFIQQLVAKTNKTNTMSIKYVPVFEAFECTMGLHDQYCEDTYGKKTSPLPFKNWTLSKTIFTALLYHTFGLSWNLIGYYLYGNFLTTEGLHMNDRGAEVIAKTIAATIQSRSVNEVKYSFM